jgi:hypothetical protein
VPEASVHKNDFAKLGEYEVGLSRKGGSVKPETETQLADQRAHAHFRFGVSGLNAGHVAAALSGGVDVGHRASLA